MGQRAAAGTGSPGRALARADRLCLGRPLAFVLLLAGLAGPPPSLPAEVIRELAARARAAERALRAQMAVNAAKKKPAVRVRASVQPTFVRFVFEMPDGVNVSSVLNDQKLTLQFNSVLNFDLADAKVAAPPNIASINQRADIDASAVDIVLIGEVDVHSFREEKNYVVDVAFQQAEKPALAAPNAEAKPAVPAKPGSASRISRDKALKESPPPQQPAEIPPVTSETIAGQARIEIKPAQATEAPAATPAVEKVTPAQDNAAPAAEKAAAAPEQASPPAEAAKVVQPAEQAQAAAAEAPKAVAPSNQAPPPAEPPKPAAPAASSPPPGSAAKGKA